MSEGVLVVGIVFGFIAFSVYMKYRSERLRHGVDAVESKLNEENKALRDKTAELQKRIEVLESIVTARGFSLRDEIDSLS